MVGTIGGAAALPGRPLKEQLRDRDSAIDTGEDVPAVGDPRFIEAR